MDGTIGNLAGSGMGEAHYNPPGYTGGIALKGVSSYGLHMDWAGKVTAPQGITSGGPVQLPSYKFNTLPPTGTAGLAAIGAECLAPSEAAGAGTGMTVFDDGHGHWFSTDGVCL